jgi:hypothetical protein
VGEEGGVEERKIAKCEVSDTSPGEKEGSGSRGAIESDGRMEAGWEGACVMGVLEKYDSDMFCSLRSMPVRGL